MEKTQAQEKDCADGENGHSRPACCVSCCGHFPEGRFPLGTRGLRWPSGQRAWVSACQHRAPRPLSPEPVSVRRLHWCQRRCWETGPACSWHIETSPACSRHIETDTWSAPARRDRPGVLPACRDRPGVLLRVETGRRAPSASTCCSGRGSRSARSTPSAAGLLGAVNALAPT